MRPDPRLLLADSLADEPTGMVVRETLKAYGVDPDAVADRGRRVAEQALAARGLRSRRLHLTELLARFRAGLHTLAEAQELKRFFGSLDSGTQGGLAMAFRDLGGSGDSEELAAHADLFARLQDVPDEEVADGG